MKRFHNYLTEVDNIQKARNETYGQELIVDIHEVHPDFFLRKNIRRFAEKMCDEINMKRGPIHLWGTDSEEYTSSKTDDVDTIKADGISCVQFLSKSSITVHAIDEISKVFVNVFSCEKFDEKKAIEFIQNSIQGNIVSIHNIIRK